MAQSTSSSSSLHTLLTPQFRSTSLNTTPKQINIIGAGVLGLSTALTLQSRHPTSDITIIAAEVPSLPSQWSTSSSSSQTNTIPRPSADYASVWAGAHYRPIPRSSRQLSEEYDLAVKTGGVMRGIAKMWDEDVTGVKVLPAVELLESVSGEVKEAVEELRDGDVYAGEGDGFRVLKGSELDKWDRSGDEGKGEVQFGISYMSYCINVHVYCVWLMSRFIEKGGRILKKRLSCVNDAFDIGYEFANGDGDIKHPAGSASPIVVNCSGRNFDTDSKTTIIRGQTVLVRNQYYRTITRQNADGSWAFLIPRPGGGGTVVGGTKEIGDVETEARPESRRTLLANAIKYFPDFVDDVDNFDVVMDNVGRRPWREGGLRIEVENLAKDETDHRVVVHGYGAGGRGYELSWGVAERIADLVDDQL